jgi:hypothetical protein
MRSVRLVDFLGATLGPAFLLTLSGCSAAKPEAGPSSEDAPIDVVQVTTLTTVQASTGLFLSASPQKVVPDYVGRAEPSLGPSLVTTIDRAEVDLALLFQTRSAAPLPELRAELQPAGAGEWSAVEHYFPPVESTDLGVSWPIELRREADAAPTGVSSEWSGWQAYGGLGVGRPARPSVSSVASAAVATLDFEVRAMPSPLVLTGDVDDLVVTNRSGGVIERALLIYSHPGGVGVTLVSELGPGASSVTGLGPKEHPPERLLALARDDLREFFVESVGEELGAAIADAKSIPFLETPGLRLISLLQNSESPAKLTVAAASTHRRVVVSHSEILKRDEEIRAVEVVADVSLDALQVASELGRFSEAKLEYVQSTGDEVLRVRAGTLLSELRGR